MRPYAAALGYAFSGCVSVIAQTLLLREAMGVAHGSELSLGIVLAGWLAGAAAGSRLGLRGTIAPATGIRFPLIASAILLPVVLILLRFARPALETMPGVGVSLGTLGVAAAALAVPFGMLFGFQIGAARRLSSAWLHEAIGAAAGGVIFTFLLIPLDNPLLAALFTSMATTIFLSATIQSFGGRHTLRTTGASIAVLAGLGILVSYAPVLEQLTIEQGLFRGYTIRNSYCSPYGRTVIAERAGERAVFSNGLPQATYPDDDAVQSESFAYLPYLFHQKPRSALVIGSRSPLPAYLRGLVDEVVHLDQDAVPAIIIDGRAFLARAGRRFDIIYVNLPSPTTVHLNRYYTVEFFRDARAALTDAGILAFRAPGALVDRDHQMTELSYSLWISAREAFAEVRVIPGVDNIFIASPRRLPPPGIAHRRLARLGNKPAFLSRQHLRYTFAPERSRWLYAQFAALKAERAMNHDLMPRGMMRGMMYWQSAFAPRAARAYETATKYAWIVLLLLLAWLITDWIGPVGTAFASGASSMGLYMAAVWGMQAAHGTVYHWIGMTTACFMAGAALGAGWARSGRFTLRVLGTETVWVLGAAIGYALLTRTTGVPVAGYIAFAGATGLLLGVQFPLVARRGGAAVYTADALGAATGALICGVLLIPAWGIPNTLLAIVALKLVTLQWWLTR